MLKIEYQYCLRLDNFKYFSCTTGLLFSIIIESTDKGQLISKANCQVVNTSKKWTNEFVFTTMRLVFVCFLEEIEDTEKMF